MAIVNGTKPFKTTTSKVMIGKTTGGYTLMYGVDKNDLTAYTEPTPANEDCIINGITPHSWLQLSGCTDTEVTVIFQD